MSDWRQTYINKLISTEQAIQSIHHGDRILAAGAASRIKPHISSGSAVTAPRIDADYFGTKYGIARLQGKNLKDRVRALISIAHPDFREELIKSFEQRYKVKY